MLFSSITFIFAFLPIVLILYYGVCRKSRTAQNVILTLASLFFYAWGEPKFVLVMIGSIMLNWLFALLIDKKRSNDTLCRVIVALSVISNLGILFIFKYLNFTLDNLSKLGLPVTVTNIALVMVVSGSNLVADIPENRPFSYTNWMDL